MNQEKRYQIFQRWQQLNPQPTTELNYRTPFELLIAVVLSAQATDVSVNKATAKLFAVADTPQKILQLGEAGLKAQIKSIGLYNSKARHILKTCQMLVSQYDSQIPQTRQELQTLPGVGRKTANVVLNTVFGQPTMAVDTHIFRISNRTGIAPGKTPLQVEQKLLKYVPEPFLQYAHHWLILHGRYVCVARKPRCSACVIADLCEYKHKEFEDKS